VSEKLTLLSILEFKDGGGSALPLCHNRGRAECEELKKNTTQLTADAPAGEIVAHHWRTMPTKDFKALAAASPGLATTAWNGDEP
jgi:hypothetical protein